MKKTIVRLFALNLWVACLVLVTAGSGQAYWVEIKNKLPASDGVKTRVIAAITFFPHEQGEWAAPGETKSLNFGGAKIGLCFTMLGSSLRQPFPRLH